MTHRETDIKYTSAGMPPSEYSQARHVPAYQDTHIIARDVRDMLLQDKTTGGGIYWATDMYNQKGNGYGFFDTVISQDVCSGGDLIPEQEASRRFRIREHGEVCTPLWMCNRMINEADSVWFGRKEVFNVEHLTDEGTHIWTPTDRVLFPSGKSWQEYVGELRIEMACGEAPFLFSRMNPGTGVQLPVNMRIGMLDRKMRVVNENTTCYNEWLRWAQRAYKSIYGYEWQGENLYLARRGMLLSFVDYHHARFGTMPDHSVLLRMADIIAWNIWQMDGISCMLPRPIASVGDDNESSCRKENCHRGKSIHRGVYAAIMDWEKGRNIKFVSLMDKTSSNL